MFAILDLSLDLLSSCVQNECFNVLSTEAEPLTKKSWFVMVITISVVTLRA